MSARTQSVLLMFASGLTFMLLFIFSKFHPVVGILSPLACSFIGFMGGMIFQRTITHTNE